MNAAPFTPGQLVLDNVEGVTLVVVADYGLDRPGVLVSSLKSLKPNATLIERAQWQVPRADLVPAI